MLHLTKIFKRALAATTIATGLTLSTSAFTNERNGLDLTICSNDRNFSGCLDIGNIFNKNNGRKNSGSYRQRRNNGSYRQRRNGSDYRNPAPTIRLPRGNKCPTGTSSKGSDGTGHIVCSY